MWAFMNCFKWIQCKPGEMLFLFLFTGTKIVSIFWDVVTCRFVLWRPLFKERMATYCFVLGGSITSGCTLMTGGVVWVLLVDNYFMINQCFCTNFGFPRTQHWSWDFPPLGGFFFGHIREMITNYWVVELFRLCYVLFVLSSNCWIQFSIFSPLFSNQFLSQYSVVV